MKYLASCDLIVLDLHSGDPMDYKLALEALRKHKFEEEKVLILISSLMAWQGTPKKLEEIRTKEVIEAEKAAAAVEAARRAAMEQLEKGDQAEDEDRDKDDEDQDDADMDDGEEQEESSIGEFQELPPKPKIRRKYKHLAFTERDYKMRNPIDEFKVIKEIEDEVLSFQKENVKTYVVSAGILYGKGEAVFNSHI